MSKPDSAAVGNAVPPGPKTGAAASTAVAALKTMKEAMTDELGGKAAIVTGASRGIGAAIAREFARRRVAIMACARSGEEIEHLAEELRLAGGKALACVCDVSVYADVAHAVARCQSEFGRLDILVNNAGLIEPIARLADSDPCSGRASPMSTTRASITACVQQSRSW